MDYHDIDNDSLVTEIFSSLRKIINAAEIYSSLLKNRTGLNASQLSCLLVLNNAGPLALSKLSKKVFLSPSMITAMIDQLEKKELVVRNRSSSDRRVILIELTEKGKEVANNAPPSFQEQLINGLNSLKDEEKISLNENLNRLLNIIVSEVLIDTSLLGGENKLVEVEASILKKKEDDS